MCDACCVDSCSRVRRSIELLHGDWRKPVCARQASWYLVVQVHNALAKEKRKKEKKRKITALYEAEGIHYSVIFEPLCKSLPSTNRWPSDPFAFSSTSSHTHTALYSHFFPNCQWPFFKEDFGIGAFYLAFALSWLSVTGTSI